MQRDAVRVLYSVGHEKENPTETIAHISGEGALEEGSSSGNSFSVGVWCVCPVLEVLCNDCCNDLESLLCPLRSATPAKRRVSEISQS